MLVDTQKLQATKKVRIFTDRLQDFVPVGGLLAEDGHLDMRELDARLDNFDNKVGEDSPCLLDAVLSPGKDKTLKLFALLGEELERFSCGTLQCLVTHKTKFFERACLFLLVFAEVLSDHSHDLVESFAGAVQIPELNLSDRGILDLRLHSLLVKVIGHEVHGLVILTKNFDSVQLNRPMKVIPGDEGGHIDRHWLIASFERRWLLGLAIYFLTLGRNGRFFEFCLFCTGTAHSDKIIYLISYN